MTVLELIKSLQVLAEKGLGNKVVVYKDEQLYYSEILFGAAVCTESNGDTWDEYMPMDNRVPGDVNSEEDFYNLIVIE